MAHGLGAPHGEGQLLRELAVCGLVAGDELLHRLAPRLVGRARGHTPGVETVHVAPRMQCVRVADRVAAVGRIDPARGQTFAHAFDLPGRAQVHQELAPPQCERAQLRIGELIHRTLGKNVVLHEAVGAGLLQRLVVTLERGLGVLHAGLFVQGLAQHLHHVADEVGALGVLAQGVQPQRLHGRTQVFQIVLNVAQELVEIPLQVGHLPGHVLVHVHLHRLLDDELAVVVLHQAAVQ
ncbi:hypothetical protein FQZ97_865920 [compost metagenome]